MSAAVLQRRLELLDGGDGALHSPARLRAGRPRGPCPRGEVEVDGGAHENVERLEAAPPAAGRRRRAGGGGHGSAPRHAGEDRRETESGHDADTASQHHSSSSERHPFGSAAPMAMSTLSQ
jgi:hypothetical protein